MAGLELLRHLDEVPVSGTRLAEALGVSRVAVWKQARRLRAAGYPVEVAGRAGYRLLPGAPVPHRVAERLQGRFGRAYRYLGRTTSTQDELRRWAQAGAPEGAVVLAEEQTAGRGRNGRPWASPHGAGLYLSVLLRPALPAADLLLLSLAAGVALKEALAVGRLKWPNDLLAPDGRKIAGILTEAELRGEEPLYVLLGVGVNVHAASWPRRAAPLEAYRPECRRLDLVAELLASLERWYERLLAEPEGILAAWEERSCSLGRRVVALTPKGRLTGTALALARNGALLVRTPAGETVRIGAGEVRLLPDPSSLTLAST